MKIPLFVLLLTVSLTLITASVQADTLEIRIGSGNDDAEELNSDGHMSLDSTDLELTHDDYHGGYQTIGLRFNNIQIDQGAEIHNAYIRFTVDETVNLNPCNLTIRAQADDNAEAFTSVPYNITDRLPVTSASTAWIPVDWNTVGAAGADQTTPSITAVIQEIIDRPGWVRGNSIILIITGTGRRVAESYDGSSTQAPLLYVEAGSLAPSVSITSPEHGDFFEVVANITIEADASDTDGTVTKVEFFEGANKLGEDTTYPYSFTWNNVPQGEYILTAKATDNDLLEGISTLVYVDVIPRDPAKLDMEEFATLCSYWLQTGCGTCGGADYSGGNNVDLEDLAILAAYWLELPPVPATLVINEFMADNDGTIADPQNEYDDWIEIYNYGTSTIDLGGMYLTDELANTTKWQFPSDTYIGVGDYLLIWADEDIDDNPNGLHASFKLSAGGEEIGLYDTDGVTLIDSISFVEQDEDISYGRYTDGTDNWYNMDDPTPEFSNTVGMAGEIYFSRLGGIITSSFTLKLSTAADTGEIRYTTNGSIPTESSFLYNDASGISISNASSKRIRARAFQPGLAPGPVASHAYLAIHSDLQSFNSNLPIVVIDTFGDTIPGTFSTDITDVYAAFIDTDETGRAAITDQADFAGRAGMRIRGQSSAFLDKKQYKFETWDEYAEDKNVSLLGFPSESDWILHNPHTDKTFMRNVLAYQWSNDMGHYASRTKFIEVFINEGGGQITWNGGTGSTDYLGVYVLMEKIKRDKNRVDIEKLDANDNTAPNITGGYIIKHDKNRPEDSFSTWAGRFYYVDPADTELTPQQKNYIEGYIEEFEAVHQSANFDDPDNGYAKYIDVESFIDHDFFMEITKEVDPYRFSAYVYKDRGGKLVMAPEWDYNWSMGNNDYYNNGWGLLYHFAYGWFFQQGNDLYPEYNWHDRLKADPEYLLKYGDRWFHLREEVLSDTTIAQTMDTYYSLLNAEAAGRNFNRWNILNTEIWPNFYYGGGYGCSNHTYQMQVEWLKNWLTGTGTQSGSCDNFYYTTDYSDRLGWIDDHIDNVTGSVAPPALFINASPADTGGTITFGDSLTMTAATEGTIYYTLDGTDPREAFTGNAIGTAYSGGITLNKTIDVRARIKNGSNWSAMNKAVFADDQVLSSLRITEIMYHPTDPNDEFIELKNIGTSSIDLAWCKFTDGIEFTFPDWTLAAGDYALVVANQALFVQHYPSVADKVVGEYTGYALSNGGEEIVLRDAAGTEIHDFDYNDWYPVTDGHNFSLCIIDPTSTDPNAWDEKEGWQAGSVNGGSPGAANPANVVANGSIVINEVLTHTDDLVDGDWIELHNTTGSPIDIGGWFLSDDIDDLKKYEIASGISIPINGYKVFTSVANFRNSAGDSGCHTEFGLSELGEDVFLSSGSGAYGGDLSGGFSITENFGASVNGVTFGRYVKSAASGYDVDFVSMASVTKEAANLSGPLIPDVVINEIMYNPSSDHDELAEYIELYNRSGSTVTLYDPFNPTNTWKFTKGVDYTFPTLVTMTPSEYILVVRTDPDIFRYVHSIPPTIDIYGPYVGALDNSGEKLELSMPGIPEPDSYVPYIRLEQVNYSDGSHPVGSDPWPTTPDGGGDSLSRKVNSDYSNDVDNWQAAEPPTPGE